MIQLQVDDYRAVLEIAVMEPGGDKTFEYSQRQSDEDLRRHVILIM